MKFVECVDYGDAPTILTSEPAVISLVDDSVHEIRCVCVQTPDGSVERRVACRLVTPWRPWMGAVERYTEARAGLMQEIRMLGSRAGMH